MGYGSRIAVSWGIGCRHGLDPKLLWLWHRLVAVAPIWPIPWELLYAMSAALKRPKKKKKVGTICSSQVRQKPEVSQMWPMGSSLSPLVYSERPRHQQSSFPHWTDKKRSPCKWSGQRFQASSGFISQEKATQLMKDPKEFFTSNGPCSWWHHSSVKWNENFLPLGVGPRIKNNAHKNT